MRKPPASMTPGATFASLGADDLDLAEITLTVEEKMGTCASSRQVRPKTDGNGVTPLKEGSVTREAMEEEDRED